MASLSIRPPTKVYDPADDAALSGAIAATWVCQDPDGNGNYFPVLSRLSFQPIFANYTSVTVKAQATLDNTTWFDLDGETTSTSGEIVELDTIGAGGPYHSVRINVTGTLSASTDTMEVWAGLEYLDN